MKLLNRNRVNKWAFAAQTTEAFFLCSMTSRQTDLTVNFISDPVETKTAGNVLYIYLTEVGNGVVDAVNGRTSLSPDGEWDLIIYEQSSATNLDPNDAGVAQLVTETIRVASGATAQVAFTGTCNDGGGGTTPDVTVPIFFNSVLQQTLTLDPAVNQTINIS